MKLGTKLSLLSVFIALLVLGGSLIGFICLQSADLNRADQDAAFRALRLLCNNVRSVVSTDVTRFQTLTQRSITTYYFSTYAKMALSRGVSYTLTQDGETLFSNAYLSLPPLITGQLPSLDDDSSAPVPVTVNYTSSRGPLVLSACTFTVAGQRYNAYVAMDVSETAARIVRMRYLALMILVGGAALLAGLTAWLMGAALKPIVELTEVSRAIAQGDYHRRTALGRGDELGELSRCFDQMTDAIEDKIASLDDALHKRELLLGALTHELKTPMTAIIGYADSLLRMPLSAAQREECARQILLAGRHTEDLSQKLMAVIRLQKDDTLPRTRFPAQRLARWSQETFPQGVAVNCGDFFLWGDETLLRALVSNLIDNALRASSPEEEVTVALAREGGLACITVTDRGCGIAADQLALVTEPFYRVDKARSRQGGGAGLGLYLCALIAKAHGGGLSLESHPGTGTRVTVHLSQNDDISSTS